MRIQLVTALSLLVACGNGTTKPSIATSKSNVCDQIAEVACYDLYTCCSEGEIEADLNIRDPETQDQCRDDIRRECQRRLATVEDSLGAGRVAFDAKTMNACLTALLAPDNSCATVSSMLPWTAPCMTSAWTGLVADGASCVYSFDCTGTGKSYCAADDLCTPLPVAGEMCAPGGVCADGFYCSAGMCTAQQAVGGTCTTNAQCMKDLFCEFVGGTGTCQMLLGGGAACTSNQACMSGSCLPGTCQGTTSACYTSTQCNGACSAGPNVGAFCTQDGNCGAGHCSVTTTTTCYAPTGYCPIGEQCIFPYRCIPGTCVGDVVCADVHLTADYCTGPIGALPVNP